MGSCVGPCFVVSSNVLSNFAIILLRKRELAALLQKCFCCHVAISVLCLLLAVLWITWSVVSDCEFSWSHSLVFCTH